MITTELTAEYIFESAGKFGETQADKSTLMERGVKKFKRKVLGFYKESAELSTQDFLKSLRDIGAISDNDRDEENLVSVIIREQPIIPNCFLSGGRRGYHYGYYASSDYYLCFESLNGRIRVEREVVPDIDINDPWPS